MLTEQEAFDVVCTRMAAQDYRASMHGDPERPWCAYRGSNGRVCAIGALITNAEAQRAEGTGPIQVDHGLESLEGLKPVFLRSLQAVHDSAASCNLKGPVPMPEGLRDFAHRFGLVLPDFVKKLTTHTDLPR